MVRRELIVKDGKSPTPDSFTIRGTVEHPTNVDYYIEMGTSVVDEGDAFRGAHLTVLGGGDLVATLNNITSDCGHFTSCGSILVRTTHHQEVQKPCGWKFLAPLSAARVKT